MTINAQLQIIYISKGVLCDGGGIIIYVGSDGKLHIKKVPGPGPDPWRTEVGAAINALEGSATFNGKEVQKGVVEVCEQVLSKHIQALTKHINELTGAKV